MAELGIDITAAAGKILTADAVQSSDVVITMGCGDTCPYFPGVSHRDWKLPDPAGQPLDTVGDPDAMGPLLPRVQTLAEIAMDFGDLPPEINSERTYSGPGLGSIPAAAGMGWPADSLMWRRATVRLPEDW